MLIKLLLIATTTQITPVNIKCGIKPIAPVGCSGAICVCDTYGNNCRWDFICGNQRSGGPITDYTVKPVPFGNPIRPLQIPPMGQ